MALLHLNICKAKCDKIIIVVVTQNFYMYRGGLKMIHIPLYNFVFKKLKCSRMKKITESKLWKGIAAKFPSIANNLGCAYFKQSCLSIDIYDI